MRTLAIVAASLLLTAAAGCGDNGTKNATTGASTTVDLPTMTDEQRLYGQVKSVARSGDFYVLRFDPAWFLSGLAANVAQAQDQDNPCPPRQCPPVAEDYVVDESDRVLTYLVPANVRGTVFTRKNRLTGPFPATEISVAQLQQILAGTGKLKVSVPLSSGVWIVVQGDTIRTFAQQYRP